MSKFVFQYGKDPKPTVTKTGETKGNVAKVTLLHLSMKILRVHYLQRSLKRIFRRLLTNE
jgi:hypothetical protein